MWHKRSSASSLNYYKQANYRHIIRMEPGTDVDEESLNMPQSLEDQSSPEIPVIRQKRPILDDEHHLEIPQKDDLRRTKSLEDHRKQQPGNGRTFLAPKFQSQLSLDAHLQKRMKDLNKSKWSRHPFASSSKKPSSFDEGSGSTSLSDRLRQKDRGHVDKSRLTVEGGHRRRGMETGQTTPTEEEEEDRDDWEPFSPAVACKWKTFSNEELWDPMELGRMWKAILPDQEQWKPFLEDDEEEEEDHGDQKAQWRPFPVDDEEWEPFSRRRQAKTPPEQSPDVQSVQSEYDGDQTYSGDTVKGEEPSCASQQPEHESDTEQCQQHGSAEGLVTKEDEAVSASGESHQADGQEEKPLTCAEQMEPFPEHLIHPQPSNLDSGVGEQTSPTDQIHSLRSDRGSSSDRESTQRSDTSSAGDTLKSDLSSFLEDAEEELSCLICFELHMDPHTPKNLDCGHVCCAICLQDLLGKDPNVHCPACRHVTTVPDSQVTSMKTNHRLRNLAEIYHKHSQKEVAPEQDMSQCSEHGDRLRYYCHTCNTVTCGTCVCDKHNKSEHDIKDLQDVYDEQKSEMNVVMEMTNKRSQENVDRLGNLQAAVQGFHNLLALEEETIDRETQQMIAKIQQAAEAKKTVIRKGRQAQLEAMDSQKRKLEIQQGEIQKAIARAKYELEKCKDWDYVMKHHELVAGITALLEQVHPKDFDLC
ncbi:uncharacterized protein [Amphiura filiformis]|uniref:uncharacterized protein n=1 Tax=Amphiura filiformis TaxID=82378 RepID=UPI003B21D336